MGGRKVFRISGGDAKSFLQNLVTNDVEKLADGAVWAALLSPQGKYLADFFLVPAGDDILLDVSEVLSASLLQRLKMYKLRSDVEIVETDLVPALGTGEVPDGAVADPRHPALGWRAYDGRASDPIDQVALRVKHEVPETGIELIPNESYPLEMGFERLNGVDFRKGCYVGQEVTARMKHKTELRKGLRKVRIEGMVSSGTEILNGAGKQVGTLYSQFDGEGLAYLRFDRMDDQMKAGNVPVRA